MKANPVVKALKTKANITAKSLIEKERESNRELIEMLGDTFEWIEKPASEKLQTAHTTIDHRTTLYGHKLFNEKYVFFYRNKENILTHYHSFETPEGTLKQIDLWSNEWIYIPETDVATQKVKERE